MAQENSPDKEKRQGRIKKPEKPYVEQINEFLLVHNKNDPKECLGVISKADEKGNYQTVTPEEKNENSFLKFDKNSSILENFIKNFWSQLKEPTHFRLIRMTFNDYKQNKQALKDLAEGKNTDAVKEFLKRYEIVPKVNTAGVWIPIFGWTLNPMFGALAMSLSSFCVVTNALRLNFVNIKKCK